MARPTILIEVVVAIRGGPLDPGMAWPPQKGLKNDGGEAFAAGDENWREGCPSEPTMASILSCPGVLEKALMESS